MFPEIIISTDLNFDFEVGDKQIALKAIETEQESVDRSTSE
jgi:hypothetical protein